ncbi:uroporphyrinogen-III C-methyltransferase [Polynucleobacter sp. IMCC30063]|uniref:uroporphyrinogen-III C-methyltransferase n=1 Tax=Polynucleobacter sp. IMCC30063 TaxID=2907298 RepID=UPI001F1E14B0|nr:uroporphyrinogen-III C-methyltransferase [Polynucleobacter sp. IMCC30063]
MSKVYLVGAGPGAADLITVRGANLLARAQIVFHDALVEPEMLALCPQAILVPVGKRCGQLSSSQRFINKRLVDAAQRYETVVRLKGGDPMLFGRADEELRALEAAGVPTEVVPGITAALAGAAAIKQSLTLRGVARSVAFITQAQASNIVTDSVGQIAPISSLPNAHATADTLVYYMGRKDAVSIAQELIAQGRPMNTPVHLLESVSTPRERIFTTTLAELTDHQSKSWFNSNSPLLIMIGEALRSRQESPVQIQAADAVLNCSATEIDNGLQDLSVFADSRRSA